MPITDHVEEKSIVADEIQVEIEEMEEVIAPGIIANHNESLVSDEVDDAPKADPSAPCR